MCYSHFSNGVHYWAISITKSLYIFSFVRNGLGLGLSTLGILLLLLLQRINLRTINERPKPKYQRISYASLKLTISFMFVMLFQAIIMLLSIFFTWNIYVLHIRNILSLFCDFILIPKFFINQNQNLKLYVSVYHWVPAPILPWQLPKNYNLNTVKVIRVKYPNNELRKSLLFAKNIF